MKPLPCSYQYGLAVYYLTPNLRLDGGCAADDGRSSSSLERLLLLALGAGPRFADDMLDRSGELRVVRTSGKEGQGLQSPLHCLGRECLYLIFSQTVSFRFSEAIATRITTNVSFSQVYGSWKVGKEEAPSQNARGASSRAKISRFASQFHLDLV